MARTMRTIAEDIVSDSRSDIVRFEERFYRSEKSVLVWDSDNEEMDFDEEEWENQQVEGAYEAEYCNYLDKKFKKYMHKKHPSKCKNCVSVYDDFWGEETTCKSKEKFCQRFKDKYHDAYCRKYIRQEKLKDIKHMKELRRYRAREMFKNFAI